MIYHITHQNEWEEALEERSYQADSLQTEGFIHCSKLEQLQCTANRYYQGEKNLLILCIDEDRLTSPVKYENTTNGSELFPHIYGPLNPSAVTTLVVLKPQTDGSFVIPNGLQDWA